MIIDTFRTSKAYTVAQAARLAGTSPQNVSRWLHGYSSVGHRMAPVFGPRSKEPARTVSFLELVEIIVVAKFRQPDASGRRRITLDRLRCAHEYARKRFQLEYPFASLSLKVEGGHVLHDFDLANPGRAVLALDLGGQWALPRPVEYALALFEFADDRLAARWYPLGRNGGIVVDPHVAAGRPTISGSRVTVEVIRNRFDGGESIDTLAEDFELPRLAIEQALRYAVA